MDAIALLRSLKPHELQFIAERDYGFAVEEHLKALRAVDRRSRRFLEGELWFPYEVVELVTHTRESGHEREFAACTVLVFLAVTGGLDQSTDQSDKLRDRAEDYGKLDAELHGSVMTAYAVAGL